MQDLFGNVEEQSKNLVIKKITLENYRNIAYKEIVLNGSGTVFSGNNGIGKTNVLEAVYWALTGQLFNGTAKAERQGIKPDGSANDVKTHVKIDFEFENFTFEKILYEKWNKNDEFQGNETVYYVNGAVVKQNKQAIQILTDYLGLGEISSKFSGSKLKDLDLFALVYNTNFLKVIDYQLLRELIIDMVGEIDFKPIINTNPTKYGRLVAPLQQHGMQLETLKVAKRTELNGSKDKDGLTTLIKTCEGTIGDLEKLGNQELDLVAIENAKTEIIKLDLEITDLNVKKQKSGSELAKDYDLQISQKQLELNKAEQKVRDEYQKTLLSLKDIQLENDINDKKNSLETLRNARITLTEKVNEATNEITKLTNTKTSKENELANSQKNLTFYRDQYQELKKPTSTETLTCPHCNTPFETHLAKEHQEVIKSKLANISENGKKEKAKVDGLNEGIATLIKEITTANSKALKIQEERNALDTKGVALKEQLATLTAKLNSVSTIAPTMNFDVEPILTIKNNIKSLVDSKNVVLQNVESEQLSISQRIGNLTRQKQDFEVVVSAENTQKSYIKNAETKRGELVILNERKTACEDIITLIKELEREMFTKLENQVANVFGENIKFQLFKINIDGSIDTRVCEMFVKDIHGNFINIKNINEGMYPIRATEFISKIKNHYGIKKSFIFVDEMDKLDKNHRQMLSQIGEQILATDCREDSKTIIERKI